MTVVVNNDENNEDLIMQNAIDKVFMQPQQTLEMLQSSFSTHPTLTIQSGTDLPHVPLSVPISMDSDVEEIQLGSEVVVDSPLYSAQKMDIPLARIDNFVDETDLFSIFDHQETDEEECVPEGVKNIKFTGTLLISPGDGPVSEGVTEVQEKKHLPGFNGSQFTVQFLNIVNVDDPLPGEVDHATECKYSKVDNELVKDLHLHENHEVTNVSSAQTVSECFVNTEEAVAFQLDEEYDYSHTRFTPKFEDILSERLGCT